MPANQQFKERKILLNEAESVARMGSWKLSIGTDSLICSSGLRKLLRKSKSDVITLSTLLENVVGEDTELVKKCLAQARNKYQGDSIDYRIHAHQKIKYLSLTIKPHKVKSKSIVGAIVDISERKENEIKLKELSQSQTSIIQILHENEQKYRLLFEHSLDPIFLANQDLSILEFNPAFQSLFGYKNGEILEVKSLFSQPKDFQFFKNTIDEFKQIRDLEIPLLTKDNQLKVCLLNGVFVPDHLLPNYCFQAIVRDLTLRKQAEADMILAERLSLTGKIARTIAHEVRNPLTNLSLALDQLRSDLKDNSEAIANYFTIIERNVGRIDLLMTEMLNSSRPKKLNLKLIDVSQLLDETLLLAKDRLQLKCIELKKKYGNHYPRILVDKDKIQIAIVNIIINAIEAMEPGKGILSVEATVSDHLITIAIQDNGKGIAQQDIPKLFDPFYSNKKSGMGLGLTSVKNILNSHSADLSVTSELGVGTTFFIYFKLAE
ncbi:MAG: ATP-binding protein [Chryseotalea sp.]